jgi:hypothetical protein
VQITSRMRIKNTETITKIGNHKQISVKKRRQELEVGVDTNHDQRQICYFLKEKQWQICDCSSVKIVVLS